MDFSIYRYNKMVILNAYVVTCMHFLYTVYALCLLNVSFNKLTFTVIFILLFADEWGLNKL